MSRQTSNGAVPAILLVVGISACAQHPVSEQQSKETWATETVHLPLLPPSRVGSAAAAVGRLDLDGPCLYLRGSDGSRVLPAFTTFDTRWEDGRLRIETESFAPGEGVTLGGGEYNGGPEALEWVQPPHPSCDTRRMWITVSVSKSSQDRSTVPEVPAPAGLRFTVEPAAAVPGTTITLMLSNGTAYQIGYNLCGSDLEQQQDGSWRHVPHYIVCTEELRHLMPGQVARYQRKLPASLGAGQYRFRTGVETPLDRDKPGLAQIASAAFIVRR